MKNKPDISGRKAQISVFIIIAIIVVAGIILFFIFKGSLFKTNLPSDLQPVYNYYLTCIEEQAETAISIAEGKGGYVENPDFSAGSEYMPFSSELDFFGIGIPYWYYMSGNGVVVEQIPGRSAIQNQIGDYISENLDCNFEEFEQKGFIVELGDADADAKIFDKEVLIDVKQDISISKDEISWAGETHSVKITSSLGKLYNLARKIYSQERDDNFLETYGVDVLRLYAPVDGVEFTCAPKIWNQQEIKRDLSNALEPNVQAIKIKGDYYNLKNKKQTYFVKDLGQDIDVNVNFLYSKSWPTKINIYPDENPLIAEAVGPGQGLGALGFCYVPYHFVYDLAYPVMIQVYYGSEVFQFPVVAVIDKNKPLQGLSATSIQDVSPELCRYPVQKVTVNTYDIDLNPVEADISFECLEQKCSIGRTKIKDGNAILEANFPQCYNGYITAKADGYTKKRYLFSTNSGGRADIILDKLYPVDIELKMDGKPVSDFAVISFSSEANSAAVSWPDAKKADLSAGEYEIRVYVYKNSSISIPAVNQQKCVEAPKSGLLGLFGMTEEKCFDINIPGQILTNVIAGGGKGEDYFVESMLEAGKLEINVDSLPVPKTLDDLQTTYNLLEIKSVYTEFK